MKNYLILFVLLFIIYLIYNNSLNIKQRNKKTIKKKIKGGDGFLNDFTNKFIIKYINTDLSDSNLYVGLNTTGQNELVNIDRNNLNETDSSVWEITTNENSTYNIKGLFNDEIVSLYYDANIQNVLYYIEYISDGYYKISYTDNKTEDTKHYLYVEGGNITVNTSMYSLFYLEPFRYGLPTNMNNKINVFTNVIDKFNYNKFDCEFDLDFNEIYFSNKNNFINTNKLTNKTTTFNIFVKNDQIKNFNDNNDDNNKINNFNFDSNGKIIQEVSQNEYILSNNTNLRKTTIQDNIRQNTNNKFTFIYDFSNQSYKIYNFDTERLITQNLGNSFSIKIGDNQFVKLDNNVLKTSTTSLTKFKLINIIEDPSSNKTYCDIITTTPINNGNVFSFSRNIPEYSIYEPSNLKLDKGYRILLEKQSDSKYTIQNLSNNMYLHLDQNNIIWKSGKNDNYLFTLTNLTDVNKYNFYLDKISGKNNTYKIKYQIQDNIKYLCCSSYNGMIVETNLSNSSEFIIIPYEEQITADTTQQLTKSINLFRQIQIDPVNVDGKTFEEINNLYIDSCIKKELFSYIIFRAYYNKLNLISNYEFNLENESSDLNEINVILDNISQNIKKLKENNSDKSYLNDKNVNENEKIIKNIFNKENDINVTLKDLCNLLDIDNIDTNNVYTKNYYNKYEGDIFSIGNDYKNKNNLCMSIVKNNWLNDGPLHYFNNDKKVIDVCIFSKNNTFISIKNTTDYLVETEQNPINYNVKFYNYISRDSVDNIFNETNKYLIMKLGYLNNGSYFIDKSNDSTNEISGSDINLDNNMTGFKLEKITNKKFEFHIYIINKQGNKIYLNENEDNTTPIVWYIMPPDYLKDYYHGNIQLNDDTYKIQIISGPTTTFTGYLACKREYDTDTREGSTYAMVHKDIDQASNWKIHSEVNNQFMIECVSTDNDDTSSPPGWLACHKWFPKDTRDSDGNGPLSVYMMVHPNRYDGAKFIIENKELKIVGGSDVTFNGYVGCHDFYTQDRRGGWARDANLEYRLDRRDANSVYLLCYRFSLNNLLKFTNINSIDTTQVEEDESELLVDKYYLNVKTDKNVNNIKISLENIINSESLPNKLNFKFIYNRPYIQIRVNKDTNSDNPTNYLDKNGKLVNSNNILGKHYIEVPYYNNPYVIIGSNNLNYGNYNKFIRKEHFVYIKDRNTNKYLSGLNKIFDNKLNLISFNSLDYPNNTNINIDGNIEFDKYNNKHLDFNSNNSITFENMELDDCKARALTENNYNYLRYLSSKNVPVSWGEPILTDDNFNWYKTEYKDFMNLSEAQRVGNQICSEAYMGTMSSSSEFNDAGGDKCANRWYTDRRGYRTDTGVRSSDVKIINVGAHNGNPKNFVSDDLRGKSVISFPANNQDWWWKDKFKTTKESVNSNEISVLRVRGGGWGQRLKFIATQGDCDYDDWNPGKGRRKIEKDKTYKDGSGFVICKVPKNSSKCTLLEKCDSMDNDLRSTVFKKNTDKNGFDEGIVGSCNNIEIKPGTIEKLYPDEFLWKLSYTGRLNDFKLTSTESPNIYIDNIEIIKKTDDDYTFKKGNMYLSYNNEGILKLDTNEKLQNIIIYKENTHNNFLNTYKTNREINNFKFNSILPREININQSELTNKSINLNQDRTHIFNIKLNRDPDGTIQSKNDNKKKTFLRIDRQILIWRREIRILKNREAEMAKKIATINKGVEELNMLGKKNEAPIRTLTLTLIGLEKAKVVISQRQKSANALLKVLLKRKKMLETITFKKFGGATPLPNITVTEISRDSIIELIYGLNSVTFTGYLCCFKSSTRDGGSRYVNVHKHKDHAARWKVHGDINGVFKIQCVGGTVYPDDTFTGWLGSHKHNSRDNRDDGSVYMMVHKNKNTASEFRLFGTKLKVVLGSEGSGQGADGTTFSGFVGCHNYYSKDKRDDVSYYLMCHRGDECCGAHFSGLYNNKNGLKLNCNNLKINSKYNILMSKKGLNDFNVIGNFKIGNTDTSLPKKIYLKNTNINKAQVTNTWKCTEISNNKAKCEGKIEIRDIDYHYSKEYPLNEYYDFIAIEEKKIFSIEEENTNKSLLEKINVTLSNNYLYIYTYLDINGNINQYKQSDIFLKNNYYYYKTLVNKKIEDNIQNITIKLQSTINGYMLVIMENKEDQEGNKIIDIIDNINLHSLFSGNIIVNSSLQNMFTVNYKYVRNSKSIPTGIKNGYNYKIKDNNSNNYLSLIKNKLTLNNNHTRNLKFKFIKVLHNEVGYQYTNDINKNSNAYFHFDKNLLDMDHLVSELVTPWTKIGKYDNYAQLNVYNYTTRTGPFKIRIYKDPMHRNYFLINNPTHKHHTVKNENERNIFSSIGFGRGEYNDYGKWKFNINDILIYSTDYPQNNLKEQVEENMESIEYEFKNFEDISKIECCNISSDNIDKNTDKIIVLDTDSSTLTNGANFDGGYFNFNKASIQSFITVSGVNLFVYNPRHNNYYKINVKLGNNLTKFNKENNISNNKTLNAHGQLVIKTTQDGKEEKLLEASNKTFENISYDKFIEKGDILIYDKNNLNNLEGLRTYVQTNYLSCTSDINNIWSVIEENGVYKFYNKYFNTYLGENNIGNYNRGEELSTIKRSYKEKYNNTRFMIEQKTNYFKIKNVENNKTINEISVIDGNSHDLQDSLYNSVITYYNSNSSDTKGYVFEEIENSNYIIKRNIFNNNTYLPKSHNRYRIRNRLFNTYIGIKKGNNALHAIDYDSSYTFDVIYINNNFIFYNAQNEKFLGENNIHLQKYLNQPSTNGYPLQKEEKQISVNNTTVSKICFKLENSFINNNFIIKNVETSLCLISMFNHSDNELKYYRYERFDPIYIYEFELISNTPMNTQKIIRNRLKNILTLTDY